MNPTVNAGGAKGRKREHWGPEYHSVTNHPVSEAHSAGFPVCVKRKKRGQERDEGRGRGTTKEETEEKK